MLTTDAVLVGLIDGPGDLADPSDVAVFSPSLLADERIGTSGSVLAIELADGVSVEELRQQLDSIPGGDRLRLERASIVTAETRSAVGTQALGLWILAGLAAVATIVALGQLIVRHTRLTDEDTSTLSALGAPRAQIVGETTGARRHHRGDRIGVGGLRGDERVGHFPFRFRAPCRAPPRLRDRSPRHLPRRPGARLGSRRLGRPDDACAAAQRRSIATSASSTASWRDATVRRWPPAYGSPTRPETRRPWHRGSGPRC